MTIGLFFHAEPMTAAHSDETIQRLEAPGAARPEGRLHDRCFGAGSTLMVFDVSESQEASTSPVLEPIHNITG